MKFQNQADHDQVLKLFRELGIKMTEKERRKVTDAETQRPFAQSTSHGQRQASGQNGDLVGYQPSLSARRPRSTLMAPPSRSSISGHGLTSLSTSSTADYDLQRSSRSRPPTSILQTNLDDLLPPARDLPFTRPNSARDLTPLPAPTPVSMPEAVQVHSAAKQTKKRKATERSAEDFYKEKISSPKGALRLEPSRESYSLRSRTTHNSPSSEVDSLLGATSPRALTISSPNISLLPAASSTIPRTADTGIEALEKHGAFLVDPATAPTITSSEKLRQWAAIDSEQRMTLLNQFFCEKLEDEGFIELCEDVEACWRRIGLGLR